MSTKEVRFAVMIDSTFLKKWQIECIQKLVAIKDVQLNCFFINDDVEKNFNIKSSIGYRFLERSIRNKGALEVQAISNYFPVSKIIPLKPEKDRFYTVLNQQDLEIIKSHNLDFILRFGFGILKRDVLTVPKYGIWSFHHADHELIRGGPTGFWDIHLNHHTNGAMLQRLTNQLDAGIILKSGLIKTSKHSFKENVNRILMLSTDWPAQVVKQYLLNKNTQDFPIHPIQKKATLYKTPNNLQVLSFLSILILNKLKFHWNELFIAEFWNIGVAKQEISTFSNQQVGEIDWAPQPPKGKYRADPFANSKDSESILYESFNYKTFKGEIHQIKYHGNNWSKSEIVLQSENHLSYPYCIKEDEKVYLLPESHESGKLILKCLSDGTENKLLSGAWLDPTLIKYQSKWWLFCSHKKAPNEQLYLFFAEQIEGPYIAHTLNPVITDVRNARPAGTPFIKNGKLYRPAQNCLNTYGGSIRIQELIVLTETNYEEQTVNELFPNLRSDYPSGIHTIASFGNYTLIDGKKHQFSLTNLVTSSKRKLNRLLKR
tara:strand:- start:6297 stop:7928 length:1632 start_codon:yes stop_codon:yes gene_type:complete